MSDIRVCEPKPLLAEMGVPSPVGAHYVPSDLDPPYRLLGHILPGEVLPWLTSNCTSLRSKPYALSMAPFFGTLIHPSIYHTANKGPYFQPHPNKKEEAKGPAVFVINVTETAVVHTVVASTIANTMVSYS